MFDWVEFLHQNHIEYVTSGPNVAHGNVNIRCPMCGELDPSHHMGIAINGSGWSCWRNPRHRGRSPVYLVALLSGVSVARAREIVGYGRSLTGDVLSSVMSIFEEDAATTYDPISMPKSFRKFQDVPRAKMYVDYLVERGYKRSRIFALAKRYGLRYSNLGPFKGRIIFPVYFEGELMSWTGRTVYKSEAIRYKTLSWKAERAEALGLPVARGPINDFLLWYDDLMLREGGTLVLVEGPFDALRIRYLGEKDGIVSTCFFTSSPTLRQVELLREIVGRYDRICLVLDRGMISNLLYAADLMSALKVEPIQMPDGYDDPGVLDKRGLNKLLSLQR